MPRLRHPLSPPKSWWVRVLTIMPEPSINYWRGEGQSHLNFGRMRMEGSMPYSAGPLPCSADLQSLSSLRACPRGWKEDSLQLTGRGIWGAGGPRLVSLTLPLGLQERSLQLPAPQWHISRFWPLRNLWPKESFCSRPLSPRCGYCCLWPAGPLLPCPKDPRDPPSHPWPPRRDCSSPWTARLVLPCLKHPRDPLSLAGFTKAWRCHPPCSRHVPSTRTFPLPVPLSPN